MFSRIRKKLIAKVILLVLLCHNLTYGVTLQDIEIPYTIQNGNFETGDLTGWTVIEGNAFVTSGSSISVSSDTTWWAEEIPYNQEGKYHLNGWLGEGEGGTGRLRSSTFRLGGTGWITFKLGGGKNTDLVYIEVRDADTNAVVARYGNTEFADVNFPNIGGGLRLANMEDYRANLSQHIGKNLYIDIVDNATHDWGLIFADAFKTYYEQVPTQGTRAINLHKQEVPKEIANPSFETGDLTGWTAIEGNAFVTSGPSITVSSDTTWWAEEIPYNQEGRYHLNGWLGEGEGGTGRLRSSTFRLGGTGWITFKLGGGKNTDLVYIEVCDADTNAVVARYGNTEFADVNFPNVDEGLRLANMVDYKADLSEYIGANLYIDIVDNATHDWGVIFADAFHTYYPSLPKGGIIASSLYDAHIKNTIDNPSFETGDLTGWRIVEGNAFNSSNVSSDTTWWGEEIPYNQEGKYHLNGWLSAGEGGVGRLRSSTFQLGGTGWITFKLGGGKNTQSVGIEIYNAVTKELVAKFGNTEFNDINFPHIDQGMRLANMVDYKADLSDYLDKKLYIEIVDDATSDWGVIFADAFHTYYLEEPTMGIIATNLYEDTTFEKPIYTIDNPSFETEDIIGWQLQGEGFTVKNGVLQSGIEQKGRLTSSVFTLGGTGDINVLLGGKGNPNKLYIGIYAFEDDTMIDKIVAESEELQRVWISLSEHIGKRLYLVIIDEDDNGYIQVDDIQVYNRGMIAHWSFDEGQGKVAEDSVSRIKDPVHYVFNNAVYVKPQDPQWRSNGIRNGAMLLDGFSTYITRDVQKIEQSVDAITLEAWVAPRVYEWGDGSKLSSIINQHNKDKKQGFVLGMYKHGTWSMQLGIGNEWVEVWCKDRPLEKFKWNHVVATFDAEESRVKLYLNGQKVAEKATPESVPMNISTEDLVIGKNNQPVNIATVFNFNMFSGLIDEVKIYNKALTAEEIEGAFLDDTGGNIPEIASQDIDIDESVYNGDLHRPQYHALPPGNWMNESHGPIYYNGKYHLFYQHNPQGPYWHQIHWGHWVSDDMVRWENVRPALSPEAGDLDPDGIWSGSATYDRNGNPVLFYTAGNDAAKPNQRVAIATPKNINDPYLVEWEKYPRPVTVQQKGQGKFGEFRDPFVWYDEEGDLWYQLVTSGKEDGSSGTALIYVSDDMYNWEYKGDVFQGDVSAYKELGTVWELPVLLPIGQDSSGNMKHIFYITPCRDEAKVEVVYWIGTWDKESYRFIPDSIQPKLMDIGEGHLTAQCGLVTPDGRTVVFSIVQGFRTPQSEYESGWAHTNSLPVTVSMGETDIKLEPIKELENLRGKKLIDFKNKTIFEGNQALANIKGDMLEIILEFDKPEDATKFGLKVRQSPDKQEETLFYYNEKESTFKVDRNKTSIDPDVRSYGVQGGEVKINDENLKLHLYLDRSIIETFINYNKKLTTRVYPGRYDSLGLEVYANGNINIKSMEIWELNAIGEAAETVYIPEGWDKSQYTDIIPIYNHDFSTGDLSGWITEGTAFSDENVSQEELFWGNIYFNPSRRLPGGYHMWGFNEKVGGDIATGTMKSRNFILGGDGKIDFLISGGRDEKNLYLALVRDSDGKELFKQTGFDYEEYIRIRWDASDYIGEECYIKVVDNSTKGFGHINIDDVNVPVKANTLYAEGFKERMNIGERQTIQANVEDALGVQDISKFIKVAVEDEKIATVTSGGVVEGIAAGKTNVTLQYGNMKKVYPLIVGTKSIEENTSTGNSTSSVSTKKDPQSFQMEIKGAKIEIIAPKLKNYKTAVEIDPEAIRKVIQKGANSIIQDILIHSDGMSISVPISAFYNEGLQSAKKVKFEIEQVQKIKISKEIQKVIGDRPVYELNVYMDGVKMNDFVKAKQMKISIDYKPIDEEKANKIIIYYISEQGELNIVKSVTYKDGKATFITNRLGKYAVAYSDVIFTDIQSVGWAQEAIEALAARKIISGIGNSQFAPNQKVTRAQFISILMNALELVDYKAVTDFKDVQPQGWYYRAVASAHQLGIANGYPDGNFGVDKEITPQEMALLIYRAAAKAEIVLPQITDGSIQGLQEAGFIGQKENISFIKDNKVTRAQCAQIIYQLIKVN